MKQTFLFKIFIFSRPWFLFILLFITGYGIFFYKKIDSTFFPYNSMFSYKSARQKYASTYAVKVNGVSIKITGQPYWKKDFLEASLSNYCNYKKNENLSFMDIYLASRAGDKDHWSSFFRNLTVNKNVADRWPAWYTRFAGENPGRGSKIEMMQYDFLFQGGAAVLKDSLLIYSTIFF